jgi:uncharacterized membrane-anchored protein
LLDQIAEGDTLHVVGGAIWRADGFATGIVREEKLKRRWRSRTQIGVAERFAANTLEYIGRRRVSRAAWLPPLHTQIQGRHALVVARSRLPPRPSRLRPHTNTGRCSSASTAALTPHRAGFKPDIIIGDFDSVSEKALEIAGPCPPRPSRRTRA